MKNQLHNRAARLASASLVVAALALVSACFHSSGGGGSPAVSTPQIGGQTGAQLGNAAMGEARTKAASDQAPGAGTQSSTAADRVSAPVTVTANGGLLLTVSETSKWEIASDDASVALRHIAASGTPFRGFGLAAARTVGSAEGSLHVEAYTDYEVRSTTHSFFVTTTVNAAAQTATVTRNGYAPDADYLAMGVWSFVEYDGASATVIDAGAFAGGGELFAGGNVAALTGNASYAGGAVGVYTRGGDGGGSFQADVSLLADFGDGSAPGMVSGEVSNIRGGEGMVTVIQLQAANIVAGNGGPFAGMTRVNDADSGEHGDWGGRFFGNGNSGADAADRLPGSAAGTFGASQMFGTGESAVEINYLGAFGATLSAPRDE